MDEALPKCGVYQADIGNSCGDGEIDDDTLYMVMGIFRSVCLKKYKDPGGTKVCIGSVVWWWSHFHWVGSSQILL